jgi:hypothetical protein
MNRFGLNKSLLAAYAELGIPHRRVGSYGVFDYAMNRLRDADEKLADRYINHIISRLTRRKQFLDECGLFELNPGSRE